MVTHDIYVSTATYKGHTIVLVGCLRELAENCTHERIGIMDHYGHDTGSIYCWECFGGCENPEQPRPPCQQSECWCKGGGGR